jgi:O-antigen/teichoic acid export membrane protein
MKFKQGLRRLKINIEDVPTWQRFRRNVSISVLGSGFSLAIKLGQTALLTKLLRIDDYGRLLIVLNLFVFLESFLGWRVSDAMFRFFPQLKEREERNALKGLILLCMAISLASGLIIYGGVIVFSHSLADRFYPDLELGPLFRIYGCNVLISAFSGIYEPVLRMHDRFAFIVIPQVLGSLLTLGLLCLHFATGLQSGLLVNGSYNLKTIVLVFAVGALVQSVPPLVQGWRLLRPFLGGVTTKQAMRALSPYCRALTSCLVNSNLSGYLKFAISPGDIFFLGLFSSPSQVALYGLARQLTAPIALLQSNIQTAIAPEITWLVAKRKFDQLKRLVARYVVSSFLLSSLLLLSALLLGRILIVSWLQPEYRAALPVVYALTVAAWLLLVFLVFRPLAVSLDLLRWHNLALLASAGVVIAFVFVGGLNAMTMAYAQLAEVLIFRSGFNLLVWTRLKRLDGSPMVELEAATGSQ